MKIAEVSIENLEVIADGSICRVARVDGDGYKFLADPKLAIAALTASKTHADIFTFLQRLPEIVPQYPYPYEWDNLAVLPISTFDNWWAQQIGFKARNKAKQAKKKGIVVRAGPFDEALAKGLWDVHNAVPVRQGRRLPHYGKSVQTIRTMSATCLDSSVFIGAFDGARLIGFIKLTMDDTQTQAGLMHILSLVAYRDKAPTNALLVQAARSCTTRGVRHLVYAN